MPRTYADYQQATSERIADLFQEIQSLPILFVGSGLSKRYFNAPNWHELLSQLKDQCPRLPREYRYYKQTSSHPIEIGETFAKEFLEWAWNEGKSEFPEIFFTSDVHPQSYFKYKIAEHVKNLEPSSYDDLCEVRGYRQELDLLRQMNPHAIITTNYDNMMEKIFPDFKVVVGQQILKNDSFIVGEIFKIHGSVEDYDSLVITSQDYEYFSKKKKYLSAKLLAYFAEHPLIFLGYSAQDPNIRAILSDLDEILSTNGEIVPNIFIVRWDGDLNENSYPLTEEIIPLEDGKRIRVNCIIAKDFGWIYEAFKPNFTVENVNAKLMRALYAKMYNIVTKEIPNKTMEIDFRTLEDIAYGNRDFPSLLGIGRMDDPTESIRQWPFTISMLAIELGLKHWSEVNYIFLKIEREKGIKLKANNNRYHMVRRTGPSERSKQAVYSRECALLLRDILDGKPYEINA